MLSEKTTRKEPPKPCYPGGWIKILGQVGMETKDPADRPLSLAHTPIWPGDSWRVIKTLQWEGP